ncbi:hypothetical protein DFP72DRAFT_873357 [Ephemerocybe angulata]|uniref:LIM zinc-binding domain-containing protein n=1 Tax=Ephemerocybe angulata TaxID=980116 RepID=A0A8H6MCT3_9AGAR|nr:hypothetical protein DFP72DRAFT_873357 [Tulosesus angulatus]
MSTMLAPPLAAGAGRMSQLLPSVKCSTCHQPVPLAELGEHTCTAPSTPPTLPKPSVSPEGMNKLLPPRLQGRVPSPGGKPPPPSAPQRGGGPPPQQQRSGGSAAERLRVNTNSPGPSGTAGFQPRSSPLARSAGDRAGSPTNLSDPFSRPPPSISADPRIRGNSFSSSPMPPPPRSAGSPMNGSPSMEQNRFPPGRTGSPQVPPNSAPVGLPSNPRGSPGRPSISGGMPPTARNGSPAPSHIPINRNQPSPAPSTNGRPGAPPMMGQPQLRGPPQQTPPMGPPPPRSGGTPGPPPLGPPNGPPLNGPPGRNAIPFPGGPPQGMAPGPGGPPPRPPFAGHGPQRSYAPSLPSRGPGQIMSPPSMSYGGQPVIEEGIDTRSGGEAGMAGVGRKGFAAVARAAMFATLPMRPMGPQAQPPNRRPDMPRFLDIDAASRSTDTPPLSAGSGYSSHSPGPTSPLAQAQFPLDPSSEKMPPSPPKIDTSVVNPSLTNTRTPIDREKTPVQNANTPSSPFGIRLPFFEKLKNMAGAGSPVDTTPTTPQPPSNLQQDINHIERSTPTPTPPAPRPNPPSPESPAHSRSKSTASSLRYGYDSESDYGGLAYDASTDNGDDSRSMRSVSMRSDRSLGSQKRRELPPVPPLPSNPPPRGPPSTTSVSSSSASASNRVHFTSAGKGRSDPIPISKSASGGDQRYNGGHSRNTSTSSYSSASSVDSQGDVGGRKRTNSSAIAQALGLSQTPPRDYSKLGGPGVPSRISRLERSASNSSLGSRSAYSRTTSVKTMLKDVERDQAYGELEKQKAKAKSDEERRRKASAAASELVKSRSVGVMGARQRTAGGSSISGSARGTDYAASEYERGSIAGSNASGSRAQRSNTVQGMVSSPESKGVKLPVRAKTTTNSSEGVTNASGDGSRVKERRKKEKVCIKCRKLIDDGRWIQVDTGGVLCERCWKNMYLPKCRRCNLPIEKQAVSSSDGQLKGKYHKECFNCHTCHKPFPDKTFYVFDGKPFCAYHYHEANDSLCAAARCGQPIEGPCAVSHAGDRYHPDCMTCEHPGYPECRERLTEYFEVDGRMLCERHANAEEDDGEDGEWVRSAKATRRITRFIDLNANNGGGGGGGNEDGGLR